MIKIFKMYFTYIYIIFNSINRLIELNYSYDLIDKQKIRLLMKMYLESL